MSDFTTMLIKEVSSLELEKADEKQFQIFIDIAELLEMSYINNNNRYNIDLKKSFNFVYKKYNHILDDKERAILGSFIHGVVMNNLQKNLVLMSYLIRALGSTYDNKYFDTIVNACKHYIGVNDNIANNCYMQIANVYSDENVYLKVLYDIRDAFSDKTNQEFRKNVNRSIENIEQAKLYREKHGMKE